MWVKICANTTLNDARDAAEAGADAVGFVFAPSRRQVTPAQVRAIAGGLPGEVERVGVFAQAAAEDIVEAARFARLTAVQLHGGHRALFSLKLQDLLGPGVRLIETLHWQMEDQERSEAEVAAGFAAIGGGRVLVDAKAGGASGGLGVSFDWARAGEVFSRAAAPCEVILAGGLRPETVAEAIRLARPWGVDVASGVEQCAGVKDRARVRAFVEQARLGTENGVANHDKRM